MVWAIPRPFVAVETIDDVPCSCSIHPFDDDCLAHLPRDPRREVEAEESFVQAETEHEWPVLVLEPC